MATRHAYEDDEDDDGGYDDSHGFPAPHDDTPAPNRWPSGIYFNELADDEFGVSTQKLSKFPFLHNDRGKRRQRPPVRCLPLLDVNVEVAVAGTIAQTTLTQNFTNFSNVVLEEAIYAFPLYDGSAVISFRCFIGNDRILEGHIKPRAEAKARYEKARAERKVAALLEEHTPELFEIRLGNIPARTVIKTVIEYVNELKAEPGGDGLLRHALSGDGIILTIPTSVAPRYGPPPSGLSSFATATAKNRLQVTVRVNSPVPLTGIESATHPISVAWEAPQNTPVATIFDLADSEPSHASFDPRKHAKATLANKAATLGRDFSLLIRAAGTTLLASRAVMEASADANTPHALMISLQPRSLFPLESYQSDFQGEIVMVADCSGSMRGAKMDSLKDALQVLIRSLPPRCLFNVYSFGTEYTSAWSRSKRNTARNTNDALRFVSAFKPDKGGTDIVSVFSEAVQNRTNTEGHSTQIILLSDGGLWGTDEVIDFVRKVRADQGNAVRFFALGVGDIVSHRLIEGVSKDGGGFGEVITEDHSNWNERVVRMLQGALMPESWSCQFAIDGVPTKQLCMRNRNLYEPEFIQAPFAVPSLHSFTQLSVYLLVKTTKTVRTITISGTTPSNRTATVTLDVERSTAPVNTLHYLAAKAAVRDLEQRQSWMHDATSTMVPPNIDQIARQVGERLGMRYHITGRWTSFVAVEDGQETHGPPLNRGFEQPGSDLSDLLNSKYTGVLGGIANLGRYLKGNGNSSGTAPIEPPVSKNEASRASAAGMYMVDTDSSDSSSDGNRPAPPPAVRGLQDRRKKPAPQQGQFVAEESSDSESSDGGPLSPAPMEWRSRRRPHPEEGHNRANGKATHPPPRNAARQRKQHEAPEYPRYDHNPRKEPRGRQIHTIAHDVEEDDSTSLSDVSSEEYSGRVGAKKREAAPGRGREIYRARNDGSADVPVPRASGMKKKKGKKPRNVGSSSSKGDSGYLDHEIDPSDDAHQRNHPGDVDTRSTSEHSYGPGSRGWSQDMPMGAQGYQGWHQMAPPMPYNWNQHGYQTHYMRGPNSLHITPNIPPPQGPPHGYHHINQHTGEPWQAPGYPQDDAVHNAPYPHSNYHWSSDGYAGQRREPPQNAASRGRANTYSTNSDVIKEEASDTGSSRVQRSERGHTKGARPRRKPPAAIAEAAYSEDQGWGERDRDREIRPRRGDNVPQRKRWQENREHARPQREYSPSRTSMPKPYISERGKEYDRYSDSDPVLHPHEHGEASDTDTSYASDEASGSQQARYSGVQQRQYADPIAMESSVHRPGARPQLQIKTMDIGQEASRQRSKIPNDRRGELSSKRDRLKQLRRERVTREKRRGEGDDEDEGAVRDGVVDSLVHQVADWRIEAPPPNHIGDDHSDSVGPHTDANPYAGHWRPELDQMRRGSQSNSISGQGAGYAPTSYSDHSREYNSSEWGSHAPYEQYPRGPRGSHPSIPHLSSHADMHAQFGEMYGGQPQPGHYPPYGYQYGYQYPAHPAHPAHSWSYPQQAAMPPPPQPPQPSRAPVSMPAQPPESVTAASPGTVDSALSSTGYPSAPMAQPNDPFLASIEQYLQRVKDDDESRQRLVQQQQQRKEAVQEGPSGIPESTLSAEEQRRQQLHDMYLKRSEAAMEAEKRREQSQLRMQSEQRPEAGPERPPHSQHSGASHGSNEGESLLLRNLIPAQRPSGEFRLSEDQRTQLLRYYEWGFFNNLFGFLMKNQSKLKGAQNPASLCDTSMCIFFIERCFPGSARLDDLAVRGAKRWLEEQFVDKGLIAQVGRLLSEHWAGPESNSPGVSPVSDDAAEMTSDEDGYSPSEL